MMRNGTHVSVKENYKNSDKTLKMDSKRGMQKNPVNFTQDLYTSHEINFWYTYK